jgi:hypothetical protein
MNILSGAVPSVAVDTVPPLCGSRSAHRPAIRLFAPSLLGTVGGFQLHAVSEKETGPFEQKWSYI